MSLKAALVSQSGLKWKNDLRKLLEEFSITDFEEFDNWEQVEARAKETSGPLSDLFFIDQECRPPEPDTVLPGRFNLLVLPDREDMQALQWSDQLDDVLIYPFRPLEVASKIRMFDRMVDWSEIANLNANMSELIEQFKEDIELAAKLQKAKMPERFPNIKGFKLRLRYLVGMGSGGDHFDIVQSRQKTRSSLFLSTASSYGLSSALITALIKVANRISVEHEASSSDVVRQIADEIQNGMRPRDRLSLVHGIYNRKNMQLSYINLGQNNIFRISKKGSGLQVVKLPFHGRPIVQGDSLACLSASTVQLQPGERLAMVSQGLIETVGGEEWLLDCLTRTAENDQKDLLNETTFRLKENIGDHGGFPQRDCTMAVMDVDQQNLRVASG